MELGKNTENNTEKDPEGKPEGEPEPKIDENPDENPEERPTMKFELQVLSPTHSEVSVPSLLNESVSTAASHNRINTPQLQQLPVPAGSKVVKNVSHNSSSLTWQSAAHCHKEEFQKYKRRLHRMYKPSALVPWSATEWNAHLAAENQRQMKEKMSKIEGLQQGLDERKLRAQQQGKDHVPKPGERIKTMSSGRGVVFAQTSIWCPLPAQRHGGRIWPSREELRYEGDERVATGYGRYLPIVRDWQPEQPDMPWDQVPALPPHDFDQVNKVLSRHDIYGEHTEINKNEVPFLLNSDLLDALDENDFDVTNSE